MIYTIGLKDGSCEIRREFDFFQDRYELKKKPSYIVKVG
jgi:hypothetical protein